jgi:hypothetical protein
MITEILNAFCEAIKGSERIVRVKEICAEFSVGGVAFEHVKDGDGHGVSYGNNRFFLATSRSNAPVLNAVVTALFPHRAMRGLDQGAT